MEQKMRRPKADIVTVAHLAGVSPATVSRTFNHPNLVKAATRQKIALAVEQSGYIRNRAAQTMHGKRSGTIGFIVPTINNAIFSEIIQSFADGISGHGFTLLIASHGFDLRKEYEILRKLLEHRVDGVALIGLDHSEASYRLIERQRLPAIAGWNYMEDSKISCVGPDNGQAGKVAAAHLLALGHRQIGIVFPAVEYNDRARLRLKGALAALEGAGIKIPHKWRLHAPYSEAHAKQACMALLSRAHRPSALLCGNDIIAHGAIYAAQRLGIAIPEALSLIGIGDFRGSADIEPSLTSVRIPARRIGAWASRHLVNCIAAPSDFEIIRQKFDVKLVARSTTMTLAGGQ